MLAALVLSAAYQVQRAPRSLLVHARASPVRCDEDRCYYGAIGEDGSVLADPNPEVSQVPVVKPSPSLTPLDVVDNQFRALSRGELEPALAFVSPAMKEQYSLDVAKYEKILGGPAFDGLVGCYSWKVLRTSEPCEDKTIVSLQVLPKPVPGCVKTSGIAGQGGITWPTFFAWHLAREADGCWSVEQMAPEQPPIDVPSSDGTPTISQAQV